MPIDHLPALAGGQVFPREDIQNLARGWTGTFSVPPLKQWTIERYRNLPDSLKRGQEFYDQVADQIIYRIPTAEHIYWLPAIELARMFYFQSVEIVRAAVHQGNVHQLGKSSQKNWIGEVMLSSNIPVSYLNNLQFRKFASWLFFNPEAEFCFGSIFTHINRNTRFMEDVEVYTFDFAPPDLGETEISYAGFTGTKEEKDHIFIREIRSVSGIKAPDLELIYFSHPDDALILEANKNEEQTEGEGKNNAKVKPHADIKNLDPENVPNGNKKRYLIKVGNSGFNFDSEPDLRRPPRYVKALPPWSEPVLDEYEVESFEDTVSVLEGSDHGTVPRADIDNLEPPELIDALEKLAFFQLMLEKLEHEHSWNIQTSLDEVPKQRCRSAHLIDNRPRQYCHAIFNRDRSTIVQILEIELKADESLSTLIFRSDDTDSTFQRILDELMSRDKKTGTNAMKWKRKFNSEHTKVVAYLDHPDKKIKNEEDALMSWIGSAAGKVMKL